MGGSFKGEGGGVDLGLHVHAKKGAALGPMLKSL